MGGGWVVQLITLSLPTRVEVELGCDKRVLLAQMNNPCNGDFAKLVSDDFKMIETNFDIDLIANTSEVMIFTKLRLKRTSENQL